MIKQGQMGSGQFVGELAFLNAPTTRRADECDAATRQNLRDGFETWVNNPCLLARIPEPGFTDEYEHPWTSGAWAAWKACAARR